MITILCFGDSNVWGCIPGTLDVQTSLCQRYPREKRWTGPLQNELGNNYYIIEDGINGRTATLDEITPERPYKNGLIQLPISLDTHYPIDLIVLWLGTNDTKKHFKRSAREISEGLRQLVKLVKESNKGPNKLAPKVLIISPQPVIKVPSLNEQRDDESIEKTKVLASHYHELAKEEGCEFFDAATVVTSSKIDGVHLDEVASQLISKAIAEKIKQIT